MKLKLTEAGIVIPKELLGNSQEVEITQPDNQIIITKINHSNMSILDLSKNSVESDINDSTFNQIETRENNPFKSCYDLAEELGIIGIAKNLPADLSTNQAYFEGFGTERKILT